MKNRQYKEKDLYKAKYFDRNDEKYWIFGMFYCNRNDNLMFVRGRGNGMVPNYGHKAIRIMFVVGVMIVITFFLIIDIFA